jgi:hypothetical protein
MKIKFLVGALVFLIVVNLATLGSYVYYTMTRHHGEEGMDPADRSQFPPPLLHMGVEEREKVFQLLRNFHEESSASRSRIQKLEDDLFKLLQQDSVDQQVVEMTLREISNVKLEISTQATRKLMDAKSFLNAEQRGMLFDALMKMRPAPPGGGSPQFEENHPPPPFGGPHDRPNRDRGFDKGNVPPSGPPPEKER